MPTINILNNINISADTLNNGIGGYFNDCISSEFITDPVTFPGVDDRLYDRSSIDHLFLNNSLDGVTVVSPLTRAILTRSMMRSARLFMDVCLIAVRYARLSNPELITNSRLDSDDKIALSLALVNLMNDNDRRSAAEAVLKLAMQSDLRNTDCGLTNVQLEKLTDWKIITTSPIVPSRPTPRRSRPLSSVDDNEEPPANRGFFMPAYNTNIYRGWPFNVSSELDIQQQAVHNPVIAANLGV